jgi:hypothetical protein
MPDRILLTDSIDPPAGTSRSSPPSTGGYFDAEVSKAGKFRDDSVPRARVEGHGCI